MPRQRVKMTLKTDSAAVESYRLEVESYWVDTPHCFFFFSFFWCLQVHNPQYRLLKKVIGKVNTGAKVMEAVFYE